MSQAELSTAGAAPADASGAEGGAIYDTDDIAARFAEGMDEPAGEDDLPEGGGEPAPADDGGAGADPEPAPEYPMPEGWDEAIWQGIAPDARGKIDGMVKAHAQAIAAEKQAQAQARAEQQAFAAQANAQLQQSLQTMKQIVEAEYGGIDWASVAQSDPAAYVQLQQQYAQRMQAIQGIQQNIARQVQAFEQKRAAEVQARMQTEFDAVLPEIKAMVGNGFNGKNYAAELVKYMTEQGMPQEVVNGLTRGYELKLVAKAYAYDKLQQQRQAAAQKVADAPKVQAPRGAAPVESDGRAEKARALLRKNPNSTDAIAALFMATE